MRYFLARPRLWPGPLLATAAASLSMLAVAGLVGWWLWPETSTGSWHWLGYLWAILLALVAGACAWLVLLPAFLSLAFDRLAARILAEASLPAPGEALLPAIRSAVVLVVRSLPLRIFYLLATFLSGPFSPLVVAFGLGHLTVLDTVDIALASRGWPLSERLAAIRRLRGELLGAALVAGVTGMAAAATIVLWPFWLPGVMCGAVLRTISLPPVAAVPAGR